MIRKVDPVLNILTVRRRSIKIEKVSVLKTKVITRESYPYAKPTDYYNLNSMSPFKSAFMDEICFISLDTDDGTRSVLETSKQVCDFVSGTLSTHLIGQELSNITMIWDLLYRYTLPIGRTGLALHAVSAVNLLMYDALAKSLGIPVYVLLGGKTRDKVKAYASHLHPSKELEDEARKYVEEGYTAMKMRFCCGPADPLAVDKNVELVKRIRDSVGYSVELAGDAWMSWNLIFSLKMMRRLEKYEMSWVEEPLLPDDFDGYKYLTKSTDTPVAAGEHHYHVYDFKRLLDSGVRILQPDSLWVGGITPMKRIVGIAEAYGAVVIPHTSNIYNLHFIISEPESIAPMAEYLTKYRWLEDEVENPPKPENGYFKLGEEEGFGIKYKFKVDNER
ncbi:enolase C-terminal domain-like protein [Stygiolobus caldivivus]|uniref:L-rhamnonate dehydratase n=1 Tax=Stygiolobus caldivivus TaxID=2824673 RepID=A0A8D5U850_9CREN|nr:enolase C-terminal domain-like protein [Stygiolobus caldivivus]BCU71545.1 L-rhamnonate dehydratase [Stygiolobus caldivivus]